MKPFQIGNQWVGPGHPCFIVAEISANHNQSFNRAVELVKAAKETGADAVKVQTYTPDTLTIDCNSEWFQIGGDSLWAGKTLYQLYKEAYMPWDWQPKLKQLAEEIGLEYFSTPFDDTSVDFLEKMEVPAYKIASFELVDLPLLQKVARTQKPVIASTGMASLGEIEEAVRMLRENGTKDLTLLKCTSAYPASLEEMNLRTIPHLSETFDVIAGLSDHTLGLSAPIAAVSLGVCIIEKHFTIARTDGGPDAPFSLEPKEFKMMVDMVREVEKALGSISYQRTPEEGKNLVFRRSLFAVEDIRVGEYFSQRNVRIIRPGYGLGPRYLKDILGNKARCDIKRGTPVSWGMVGDQE